MIGLKTTVKRNRRLALSSVSVAAVFIVLVGIGMGVYVVSMNYSGSSQNGMYQFPSTVSIIKNNMTVVGKVAGIPCGSLRLPCVFPTNRSTISAVLIKYTGSYYYVSYLNVNNTRFAIWYNNSTYYCVSPKVQWANSCPSG